MAQFFTFTPKRKEDGAIDFYTLMEFSMNGKRMGLPTLPGMESEK
mgnify:CR=1 FL=1